MSRCTGGAFVCANSASLSGHGPFWRAFAHALVFAAGKVFGGLGRWRVHGRLSEALSVIFTSSRATGEEGREENWVRETMGRNFWISHPEKSHTCFGPRVLSCYESSVTAQLT